MVFYGITVKNLWKLWFLKYNMTYILYITYASMCCHAVVLLYLWHYLQIMTYIYAHTVSKHSALNIVEQYSCAEWASKTSIFFFSVENVRIIAVSEHLSILANGHPHMNASNSCRTSFKTQSMPCKCTADFRKFKECIILNKHILQLLNIRNVL